MNYENYYDYESNLDYNSESISIKCIGTQTVGAVGSSSTIGD